MSVRSVNDPFLNKDQSVSYRLVDRLRGRYAVGPTGPSGTRPIGEPEFGWRLFETLPIQHEAADRIDQLEAALLRINNYVSKFPDNHHMRVVAAFVTGVLK